MGTSRRYPDAGARAGHQRRLLDARGRGPLATLTDEQLQLTTRVVSIAPERGPMWALAWLRFGDTDVRCAVLVKRWTADAVGVELEVGENMLRCWRRPLPQRTCRYRFERLSSQLAIRIDHFRDPTKGGQLTCKDGFPSATGKLTGARQLRPLGAERTSVAGSHWPSRAAAEVCPAPPRRPRGPSELHRREDVLVNVRGP